MNITLVGSESIGIELTVLLKTAGHSVQLGNFSRSKQARLSGYRRSQRAPVDGSLALFNVIILDVPFGAIPLFRWMLKRVPGDAVIVDATNYIPSRDGSIPAIERGENDSVWAAKQLGRPVIKAWNNVLPMTLRKRSLAARVGTQIALPVAGEDARSKEVVVSLVEDSGFAALDAGSLEDSWRQQPITKAFYTDLSRRELQVALKTSDRARADKARGNYSDLLEIKDDATWNPNAVERFRQLGA